MARIVGTIVTAAVLVLVAPAAAHAQQGTAQIRIAHLSPDTPGVDVYVDGTRLAVNVGFRTVSDYVTVPAGAHRIELRPSGAQPSAEPVLAATQLLAPGKAYTAAGVGARASLRGAVFVDDLAPPPAGDAKVRFLHAAVGTGTVKVAGVGSFPDTAFGRATPYEAVRPGTYRFTISDEASNKVLLQSPAVELSPGIVYTVAALGGAGQPLRVLPIVDARAAAVAPAGGIATGAGGLARRHHTNWLRDAMIVVGAALVVTGLVMRKRSTV